MSFYITVNILKKFIIFFKTFINDEKIFITSLKTNLDKINKFKIFIILLRFIYFI